MFKAANKLGQALSAQEILAHFAGLDSEPAWSFADCTTAETARLSHSYHRYPAKFIAPLARQVIELYSKTDGLVCDPFMGSGTTLLEALLTGRAGVGVDINPVARLISQAKIRPLEPALLSRSVSGTLKLSERIDPITPEHKRIDYWFTPATKLELGRLLAAIMAEPDEEIKTFLLCGFSHILKNCSRWSMKSSKPLIDSKKAIPSATAVFKRHILYMSRRNTALWEYLTGQNIKPRPILAECGDARSLPGPPGAVDLIVTSPPYVTSYEYSDLHQLTVLWLGWADNLKKFRKQFIGTGQPAATGSELFSPLARQTVASLESRNRLAAKGVMAYFKSMQQCFTEWHTKLRSGGTACIVIGDTKFRGINIPNAEIFVDTMQHQGYRLERVIKRMIPMKTLPQTRDPQNGKFTSTRQKDLVQAYPHEFLVFMKKI